MKLPKLQSLPRELSLIVLLIVICLGFGLTNPNFRDPYNLLDRTRHWVEIGIIAVPMTYIIATGGIDLSVGSMLALCGIVMGLFFEKMGMSIPVALVFAVLTGAAAGAFNALSISLFRVPPLVTTLATMAMYRGLAIGFCQADPVRGFPESFTDWASLSTIGFGDFQLPYQTLIMILIVTLGIFVFRKSCLGRWTVQIGESEKASYFTTVPVRKVVFTLYMASGVMCGLASIFYTGRFATAHPSAARALELEVIACVVIGGTRITGGSGSVLGTFLGVLIIGCLRFGMEMQGILQKYQIILFGVLVIVTAIANEWLARRSKNA